MEVILMGARFLLNTFQRGYVGPGIYGNVKYFN